MRPTDRPRSRFGGLRARKLRTFVTVLAVLLGVAFIAGSYVLTDTINKSFDEIFDVAYAGTDVAVSVQHHRRRATTPRRRPSRRATSTRCARSTGWRRPRAASSRSAASSTRRATSSARASLPSSSRPRAQKPFDTLTYIEGRPPRTAGETSLDQSTADREHLGIGDTLRIAAEAGVKAYTDRRHPAARRHLVGRVEHGPADAARGPAPDPEGGRARRDLRQGRARASRPRSWPAHRPRAAAAPAGRDGAAGRRAPVAGHQGPAQFLPRDPARVRRRGAAGRQLPDLQHVLDHGRPAHPRVRACCARWAPRAGRSCAG